MVKLKKTSTSLQATREPILTARFVIAVLLMAVGLVWLFYYYFGVHPTQHGLTGYSTSDYRGPSVLRHLRDWNYLIAFGLFFLGLILSAHPSTPLGRGRMVAPMMIACFVIGLAWICVYYVTSGASYWHKIWIFNDLNQKNLIVGIAWMAVGFAFATRWE